MDNKTLGNKKWVTEYLSQWVKSNTPFTVEKMVLKDKDEVGEND